MVFFSRMREVKKDIAWKIKSLCGQNNALKKFKPKNSN